MEATGARLFRGEGSLADLRTVTVGREQLIARRAVVIANGSTAAIPPIPGLDSVEFWTNRQAAIPSELPATLAIPKSRRSDCRRLLRAAEASTSSSRAPIRLRLREATFTTSAAASSSWSPTASAAC